MVEELMNAKEQEDDPRKWEKKNKKVNQENTNYSYLTKMFNSLSKFLIFANNKHLEVGITKTKPNLYKKIKKQKKSEIKSFASL